ncbi:hypothetical protein B0H14DRAFT_2577787 [Mycena olivaceomarginata]|nr:hypothetical protein B0H14DRAFT_2577787 [Mycena olivaceomarginata]
MVPAGKNKAAATPPPPATGNAAWLKPDEQSLIVFLLDEKTAAGDNGQFKAVMLPAAAADLNLTCTKGGPKLHLSCGRKYRLLHKFWGLVDMIINTSGWTWSDEHSVTVGAALG